MNQDFARPPSVAAPSSSINQTFALELAFAIAVSAGLAIVTFRAGPLLTFDGYHYCELAKKFTGEWPDRFGNHWPFGWPLAGGVLGRIGLSGYQALLVLSFVSLAALLTGAARVLDRHPLRSAVLIALGASPVIAPQIGSVLTELPFAAALLGLALCLAEWPSRAAIWGAAVCSVLALSIRYAGLVALAVVGVWIVVHWHPLRAARRTTESIAAWCAAGAASAALLYINILQSGHASGAGRGQPPGLAGLPAQLTDFGWSMPSALIAGGLRDRIGPYSPAGLVVGAACFAALTALCGWAWFRPRSVFSRPLALTAFGYCTGMAVLRCVGEFDALHVARTFLPALFPLGLLFAGELSGRRVALAVVCAALLAAGLLAAGRGISREIGGDVRPTLAALRIRALPGDTIAINDHAFAIAAYLPQRTRRTWPESAGEFPTDRFLVVAAKPRFRNGSGSELTSVWLQTCERLVASGHFKWLVRAPGVVALERVDHAPATPLP